MTETMPAPSMPAESAATAVDRTDPFVPAGGRIVVGVDGSAASVLALRTAARIADLTGATIDAVAVWETPLAYGYPEGAGSVWNPEEDSKALLAASLQDVFDGSLPKGLRTRVQFGSPTRRILEQAEGAALIVLGSRGHGALAGLLLGSVSTKCAAAAKCPVLIVHAPEQTGA